MIALASRPAASPVAAPDSWCWVLPLRGGAQLGRPVEARVVGTITNRPDVERRLGSSPALSDAQTIERLYERSGLVGLESLRGAFALAIVDRVRERTFVMRDHAGLEPVFYVVEGDTVVCGPAARPLARRRGTPRVNRVALADSLCERYPDPEETFFEGVRRLPGGHVLTGQRGAVSLRRYWHPLQQAVSSASAASLIDEFHALQQQAVARWYRPGRTGIFLSGGLDSGSIATAAADYAASRHDAAPHALSLALPDYGKFERLAQAGIADALSLPTTVMTFDEAMGARSLFDEALALNAQLSTPLMSVWTPAYNTLAAAGAAQGLDVVLTGIGGDEWLSASEGHCADLLRRGRVRAAIRFNQIWQKSGGWQRLTPALRSLASLWAGRLAPEAWERSRVERTRVARLGWVSPDPVLRREQDERVGRTLRPSTPVISFAAADADRSLTDTRSLQFFEERHELTEWRGGALRDPYYDVDLVDHLCRLPLEVLNLGGRLKGLVRTPLAARFPSLKYGRQPKHLADRFALATFERGFAQLGPDGFNLPTLTALGVVANDAAAQARVAPDAADRLWELLNLEAWTRYATT